MNLNRGVYVLKCDSNKYYCGSTEYLDKRIYSHIYGYMFRGMKRHTAWTKKYPVEDIQYIWHSNFVNSKKNTTFKKFNGRTVSMERVFTLMAMENYGINNVRGYCWTKTDADLESYPQIKEMLTNDKLTSIGMIAMDFIEKEPSLGLDTLNIKISDCSISGYFDECLKLYLQYKLEQQELVKKYGIIN